MTYQELGPVIAGTYLLFGAGVLFVAAQYGRLSFLNTIGDLLESIVLAALSVGAGLLVSDGAMTFLLFTMLMALSSWTHYVKNGNQGYVTAPEYVFSQVTSFLLWPIAILIDA